MSECYRRRFGLFARAECIEHAGHDPPRHTKREALARSCILTLTERDRAMRSQMWAVYCPAIEELFLRHLNALDAIAGSSARPRAGLKRSAVQGRPNASATEAWDVGQTSQGPLHELRQPLRHVVGGAFQLPNFDLMLAMPAA